MSLRKNFSIILFSGLTLCSIGYCGDDDSYISYEGRGGEGRENIHIQEGPRNEGGERTREHVQAGESQAMESPMQEQRMYNNQNQKP